VARPVAAAGISLRVTMLRRRNGAFPRGLPRPAWYLQSQRTYKRGGRHGRKGLRQPRQQPLPRAVHGCAFIFHQIEQARGPARRAGKCAHYEVAAFSKRLSDPRGGLRSRSKGSRAASRTSRGCQETDGAQPLDGQMYPAVQRQAGQPFQPIREGEQHGARLFHEPGERRSSPRRRGIGWRRAAASRVVMSSTRNA